MEFTYLVTITKDPAPDVYNYSVTVDGMTVQGQTYGCGNAMVAASDVVYNKLKNEGRIK